MKKVLLTALLVPAMALAQTFPSPTFNSVTIQTPLAVSSGGTGTSSSTGTGSFVLATSPTLVTPALGTPSAVVLTNATGLPIAGLTGLGTGVATSLGLAVTGSGGSVLATSPTIASPTITGALTATGLVTTADLATQAANTILSNATGSTASPTAFVMPSCSTSSSALQWTAGSGFTCDAGFAPIASPTFTGTVTIPAGASITGYLTSATAASTYAPLASPTLTGTPAAPTATTGTNTTQLATTAFVNSSISAISTTTFGSLYLAWFNSLPTTLPASAGILWNNGGVLSKS